MTVLHLEVLVEEYSAEVVLKNLLPKILPSDVEFEIHSFFSVDLQLNPVLQANNSPYSIALPLKSLKPGF